MTATSYETALDKLLQAQKALDGQDISAMPANQVAQLEHGKSALYQEIQALQAQELDDRDKDYQIATEAFRNCMEDLQSLSKWVAARAATESEMFSLLAKGLSVALSLFL